MISDEIIYTMHLSSYQGHIVLRKNTWQLSPAVFATDLIWKPKARRSYAHKE